jgi:predicted Zn finger-like uncharacterized protein
MSERLVTRCPRCRTAFIVRPEQLTVRKGLVRCGRCETVFRARTRPYVEADAPEPPATAAASAPTQAEEIAEATALLPQTAPAPARTGAPWTIAAAVLLLALLAQAIHFFAPRMLIFVPEARPVLAQACRLLACRADLPIDLSKTDLIRAQVLLRENAQRGLMVSAALVNRASYLQRWPAIELTLNDSRGEVLARRTYVPGEFVASADALQRGLPPKIAVPIEFAITRPHVEPSGYELRLVSPDSTTP